MFANRTEAGSALAEVLRQRGVETDLVLAIPRGGLPVARPVSDALGAPLDVVVAKKVGAPGNAELAVAAVADDGTVWRNDSLIGALDLTSDYLEGAIEHERRAAREKRARYRHGRPPLELSGKRVVIVDDGLATGATMQACVRRVSESGATSVVAAVPVGSPDTVAEVERVVDGIVVLEEPAGFRAVGEYYRDFSQVSDEEAREYLQ